MKRCSRACQAWYNGSISRKPGTQGEIMTICYDQFGNLRGPDRSGKRAIKHSERLASRQRRAAAVRKLRRQDAGKDF
jgi:hypothetical protein